MFIFLKKRIVTLFHITDQKKFIRSSSINGYISWICLICLFLTLQIVSLLVVINTQNVYLLQANRQNIFDLSCIDQAKHIIYYNRKIRLCSMQKERIQEKDIMIDENLVHFEDKDTYIECSYLKNARKMVMKVYYDDKSIVGIDIDENPK